MCLRSSGIRWTDTAPGNRPRAARVRGLLFAHLRWNSHELRFRPSPRSPWAGRFTAIMKPFHRGTLASIPFALITATPAGAVSKWISALAASGSFAVALTPAVKGI